MNIELKNIKKEITGYTIVSPEDYNHLNQFKWYKDKDGYIKWMVEITFKGKKNLLRNIR